MMVQQQQFSSSGNNLPGDDKYLTTFGSTLSLTQPSSSIRAWVKVLNKTGLGLACRGDQTT
ncbi:hypothetical protein SK128_015766 [Halocaridina rubra]|uniref:Uncharacterized protein n=1 Tax=Halocaridina rubra TaxID=373956 RepID=A0AAN8XNG4_HALRR